MTLLAKGIADAPVPGRIWTNGGALRIEGTNWRCGFSRIRCWSWLEGTRSYDATDLRHIGYSPVRRRYVYRNAARQWVVSESPAFIVTPETRAFRTHAEALAHAVAVTR